MTRWYVPRRERLRPDATAALAAGKLAHQAQQRLDLLIAAAGPGAAESPAGRRGLLVLAVGLHHITVTQDWSAERDVTAELVMLLESPSKLAGLARKLRAGLAGLEQRLWERTTALEPALLSPLEWDARVA